MVHRKQREVVEVHGGSSWFIFARTSLSKILMGRSQVQRNKTHGRPGQGRGSGRGGSSRGGPGRGTRKQDLSKLGDNSHRFENRSPDLNTSDEYDGLLDDINFSGYIEPDDLFGDMGTPRDFKVDDSLSIDVASLARCLEQLPIAERLNLPEHVGKHLEDMYGGVRKKTLAELREEAKFQVADEISERSATKQQQDSTREGSCTADEDDLEAWLDDMIS